MQHPSEGTSQFPAIIELLTVDSTNNYALRLAHEGLAQHGTTVFSHEQTAGKGQRNKKWIATSGQNIQMSLITDPQPLSINQQFLLSAFTAATVLEFFEKFSQSDIAIKWPNDIYFQDRKAGGILIENILNGPHWKWSIIGIGLNINQTSFDPDLPNPVSLKQITGKNFDSLQLAQELSQAFFTKMKETTASLALNQGKEIMTRYNTHLYKRGQQVKLKKENRIFEATIKEVNHNGQLVVEHFTEEVFNFGEIIWLI